MKTLIIQYPPEFDGELHIKWESFLIDNSKYTYQFTHSAEGNEWDTLVSAARAIIAQDERIFLKSKTNNKKD